MKKIKCKNIYNIKNVIEGNSYQMNNYHIFIISSPKYRVVMSLNIKDKIINHYVARFILLPKLAKYLDIRNCATRKNMGYNYAMKLLNKYIERYKKYNKFYILRIDISKFFYSIDHEVLKELLKDKLNNEEYKIVSSIINSTNHKYINDSINNIKDKLFKSNIKSRKEINNIPIYNYNKGLPIGNMTSQFLSIFYLYELDHYIVNNLKLKHMVRYMDDYIIISNNKNKLKEALKKIRIILNNKYKLNLNENKTYICNSSNFEFLGNIIKVNNNKTIIKMTYSKRKRIKNNMKKIKNLYRNNYISYQRYFNSMNNYMKKVYLLIMILLCTGCTYKEEYEDYNYLDNNSIRFIYNEDISLLINKDNIYYLLLLGKSNIDIEVDYLIKLNDIKTNIKYKEEYYLDKDITINDIEFKINDKVEIIFNNNKFCIYIKSLDKDNYSDCDYLYLYDIDKHFYITLNNNLLVLFYNEYTKFNYKFMHELARVWIDSYTISKDSYLTLTIYEQNFNISSYKRRGKTIHKR